MRFANVRWQPGYTWPSCVCLSTGAHAHPGCAASTFSAAGSGIRRRPPTGPPTSSLDVIVSSTTKTSNTGDIPIPERKPPLSAAVRQAEEETAERGVTTLAVLPADLPLLSAEELAEALHTLGPVVLAPASSDGGTNLLLRRPPRAIPARFGPGSFAKHVDSARSRRLPVSVVETPGLAFDLDLPEHAARVVANGGGRRTTGP